MSWQKCPVCNGSGLAYPEPLEKNCPCTVCQGQKIIHEINGRPPAFAVKDETKPHFTDVIEAPKPNPNYNPGMGGPYLR